MVWYGMVCPTVSGVAGGSLTLPVFRAGVRGQLAVTTGGRLQPVLMRPNPQLSFKTWGGGGAVGGGVPPGGRGGGLAGGRGGGSGRGSWGDPARGEGGGVTVRARVRVRVSPRGRVRVRVTELVEPVLVL